LWNSLLAQVISRNTSVMRFGEIEREQCNAFRRCRGRSSSRNGRDVVVFFVAEEVDFDQAVADQLPKGLACEMNAPFSDDEPGWRIPAQQIAVTFEPAREQIELAMKAPDPRSLTDWARARRLAGSAQAGLLGLGH